MRDERGKKGEEGDLEGIERQTVRLNAHLLKARAALEAGDSAMLAYHLEEAQRLNWDNRKTLLALGVPDSAAAFLAKLEATALPPPDAYDLAKLPRPE